METREWTVVLPVKVLSSAKSRLADGTIDPSELAFAFFRDALAAVAHTPAVTEIVVVTADPTVAATAREAGAMVLDESSQPGINAAARWGWHERAGTGGVVVMVSDLPCLTSASVEAVLSLAAAYETSFVADLDGTGTTMWCSRDGSEVTTHFGPGSRAAHAASGAADIAALHPGHGDALLPARRDVDTEDALARALALGIGPATRAALRTWQPPAAAART